MPEDQTQTTPPVSNPSQPVKSPRNKLLFIVSFFAVLFMGIGIGYFLLPKNTESVKLQTNNITVSAIPTQVLESNRPEQNAEFTLIKPFKNRPVCFGEKDYIGWTAPARYKDIFIFAIAPDGTRSLLNFQKEGTAIKHHAFPVSEGDGSRDVKVGGTLWTVGEAFAEKSRTVTSLAPGKGYKFEFLEVHLKEKTISHEFEIANCTVSPTLSI